MPSNKPVTLPDAAKEHMSPTAQDVLPPNLAGNFAPEPVLHLADPTQADALIGTTGAIDYFVFEAENEAHLELGPDTIFHFEVGVDKIVIVDSGPLGTTAVSTIEYTADTPADSVFTYSVPLNHNPGTTVIVVDATITTSDIMHVDSSFLL